MAKKMTKRTSTKVVSRAVRKRRIRKKVLGSVERPRLCVTRSNRYLVAQIIDDSKGVTVLSERSTAGKTVNLALAAELGKNVAKKALEKGISNVVFDRGGFVYHGRIAALAKGAREGGLVF